MHSTAPVTSVASRGRTLRLAFISAVISLVAAFAAVGSTIPLFNFGYGGLGLVATLFTVIAARNPNIDATGNGPAR
jgi:xanthine/uracil permease